MGLFGGDSTTSLQTVTNTDQSVDIDESVRVRDVGIASKDFVALTDLLVTSNVISQQQQAMFATNALLQSGQGNAVLQQKAKEPALAPRSIADQVGLPKDISIGTIVAVVAGAFALRTLMKKKG